MLRRERERERQNEKTIDRFRSHQRRFILHLAWVGACADLLQECHTGPSIIPNTSLCCCLHTTASASLIRAGDGNHPPGELPDDGHPRPKLNMFYSHHRMGRKKASASGAQPSIHPAILVNRIISQAHVVSQVVGIRVGVGQN